MIHVSIHKDNASAVLAKTVPSQYMPCSKHYHTKTIWFQKQIKEQGIKFLKIATINQLGDLFTKALSKATVKYL